MNFRRFAIYSSLGIFSFFPSSRGLQAAARHPLVSAPEGTVVPITWNNNGEADNFDSRIYSGDHYITVEQVAKLASAQMRWQSVSQQACLSRNTGLMCFNWDRDQVYMNGEIVRPNYKVRFEQGQLFVPMAFVTSKAFAYFSGQEFYWNIQAKRLTQEEPVTLSIPPIQNLGDRYQLAVAVKSSIPFHMLENTNQKIWIRFVRGQTEGSQILEGDDVIKEIQILQKRHSADLVIQLGPGATSHEVYFDQGTKKLTVDIFKGGEQKFVPQPTREIPVVKSAPALPVVGPAPVVAALPVVKKPQRELPAPATDPHAWTVVIDPGHGGMDPGAIGSRGTFEKDVNLKVAKELAEVLGENKNYRVVLTRDKDEFLTLSERTNIANSVKADVFISLHCNSSLSVKHEGFEVYILAPSATDQAAAAVARLENSVVSLEVRKGENSSRLSELLASMAVYNTLNESSKFASYVCRGVRKRSSIDKTEVKEANFHVLRGAQMPGILVEVGYLSHPYSELRLRSSRYLSQLAKGLTDGVLMYQQSLGRKRQSYMSQFNKPYRKVQK